MHRRHIVPAQVSLAFFRVRVGVQNKQSLNTRGRQISINPQGAVCVDGSEIGRPMILKSPFEPRKLINGFFYGNEMP